MLSLDKFLHLVELSSLFPEAVEMGEVVDRSREDSATAAFDKSLGAPARATDTVGALSRTVTGGRVLVTQVGFNRCDVETAILLEWGQKETGRIQGTEINLGQCDDGIGRWKRWKKTYGRPMVDDVVRRDSKVSRHWMENAEKVRSG